MLLARRSPVAIDIGDHAVKVVQLESSRGSLRLRDARCARVEPGTDIEEDRQDRLRSAIHSAYQGGRFKGSEAMTSLRLFETRTSHVRLAVRDRERINEILSREVAEQHPHGDVIYQWLPVAELLDRGQHQQEVLCCVADRKPIDRQVGLVEDLGLQPSAIDLDVCAQIRPFCSQTRRASDARFFAYIDLGCHCTRVTIADGDRPFLMRSVPLGGADFEVRLQEELGLDLSAVLDFESATGAVREETSLDFGDSVSSALGALLDRIVACVAECVRYCATVTRGQPMQGLRVLGGAAALPGVVEYLGRALETPAERCNPFDALGLPTPRTPPDVPPSAFATSLGLALRGMQA